MKPILRVSATIAASLLATGAATAGSAPPVVIAREPVAVGDLDTSSPAGAAAALTRLENAARKACGGHPAPVTDSDAFGKRKLREYHRCRITAIDVATVELGAPLVRAAWLERDEARRASAARRSSADLLRSAGLAVPSDLAGG